MGTRRTTGVWSRASQDCISSVSSFSMRHHRRPSTASAATRHGLQIESPPHGGRPMKHVVLILALLLPASLSAQSRLGSTDGAAAIRSHRSGVDVRWENKVGRALSELAILATAREHDQPYEWSL